MTPVIFKKFEGEITAIFPTDHMTCYAHVGQHGMASECWVRAAKPARPHEYVDLLSELRSIGYDDLVVQRRLSRRELA